MLTPSSDADLALVDFCVQKVELQLASPSALSSLSAHLSLYQVSLDTYVCNFGYV